MSRYTVVSHATSQPIAAVLTLEEAWAQAQALRDASGLSFGVWNREHSRCERVALGQRDSGLLASVVGTAPILTTLDGPPYPSRDWL